MASTVPTNISRLRSTLDLDSDRLASLTGIEANRLRLIESGEKKPRQGEIESLALVLGVPPIGLLMSRPVEPHSWGVDFRTLGNKPAVVSLKAAKILDECVSRVDFINNLTTSNEPFGLSKLFQFETNAESAGALLRKKLQIKDETQIKCSPQSFYSHLSNLIQMQGSFVFKRSLEVSDFRGFTYSGDPFPLIVVNSKDASPGAQSFTLVHELVHLIIDMIGVSDPRTDNTKVERYCNRVAAATLAPAHLVRSIVSSNPHQASDAQRFLGYVSNKLCISLFASGLRLEELEIVGRGYTRRYLETLTDDDRDEKKSGGGGKTDYDYGATQLWRYGSRFITELGRLIDQRKLSFLDAEQFLGVTEDRIVSLIERASKEQRQITDDLDAIHLQSFAIPSKEYNFDVV